MPSLSPDESMTLPGFFLSALLCSSKWALQCTPTLVWGFSVKPSWCTVLSDWCLWLILSTNKLGPFGGSERVFMCAQKKGKTHIKKYHFKNRQDKICWISDILNMEWRCSMPPLGENKSCLSATAFFFLRVQKAAALPVFKVMDHTPYYTSKNKNSLKQKSLSNKNISLGGSR